MLAYELIQAAERIGCEMVAEGENIRVMNINSLPALLREQIKENKVGILDALSRDKQARSAGFMIGIPFQVYLCSLSRKSILYIEQAGGNWEVWRETYINGRNQAIDIKVICVDPAFEYVLVKAKSYLDYLKRKLR